LIPPRRRTGQTPKGASSKVRLFTFIKHSALWLVIAAGAGAAEKPPEPRTWQPERSVFRHPDTHPSTAWRAALISADHPAAPNQWTAYRRQFDLERVPARAIARIAVDSKYWLWVNGKIVVREGGLKRGPTPTDTYFDEVPLQDHLRVGRNTLAVLVWHFGKEGFSHKNSQANALVVQLDDDSGRSLLVSDRRWRARLHPAFADTGEPHPNYRLPESNIRYLAERELDGWTQPDFDDRAWPVAVELGRVPCAPFNRLVRRPIPLWRDSELRSYESTHLGEVPADLSGGEGAVVWGDEITLPLAAGDQDMMIVAALPYNAQVTPYLEVDAPPGLTIGIQTDNYQGGGWPNVRAEYVTRAGRQTFECYGWMNGHAVHYTVPAGVSVLRLGYRESGFDTDFTGSFSCDDPLLNQLWTKAARTLYVTMRDTYMDCPDRERAQWWGDVVNELGEAFYALDRRADSLTRKGMLELIAWQRADGVLYSPIPEGNWKRDLPLQMLAAIGRQGFWTYAYYSGDYETLGAVYDGAMRYMELWDMEANGLVKPRRGHWQWGDWGKNVDMTLLANVWYHLALQGQRKSAEILGRTEDLPWIDRRRESIREAFTRTFWNGREYRTFDYKGETDDRGNALAVVAGLVPREHFPALLDVFQKQEHASPYMEKYVLEALCLMGEPARAQDRMKRRYRAMVEHPVYTTLWEGWGIGREGYGGGSINHAWSGGPLTIMSQYFAGIAPLEPAFMRFGVFPQLGKLNTVEAAIDTRYGKIAVDIKRETARFRLVLSAPQGTTAVVGIPMEQGIDEVRLNGRIVWTQEQHKVAMDGVWELDVADGYLRFEVGAGEWAFLAEMHRL